MIAIRSGLVIVVMFKRGCKLNRTIADINIKYPGVPGDVPQTRIDQNHVRNMFVFVFIRLQHAFNIIVIYSRCEIKPV